MIFVVSIDLIEMGSGEEDQERKLLTINCCWYEILLCILLESKSGEHGRTDMVDRCPTLQIDTEHVAEAIATGPPKLASCARVTSSRAQYPQL